MGCDGVGWDGYVSSVALLVRTFDVVDSDMLPLLLVRSEVVSEVTITQ